MPAQVIGIGRARQHDLTNR